ncbi:hypothetical protein [Okeania sp.]|uniref:hypothetical protein n=1 Tax=Okeania sp. TaxID=3100323 RepID=UPI002B4ABFBB|nr:hypothetical protein [Okeania sp.]MEB3339441.1 hypothetical protein [Okeania sp.]
MAKFNFKNFDKISKLTLNGSAAQEGSQSLLRLTNQNSNAQWGSAFFSKPIKITENTSFETYFQFQISKSPFDDVQGLVFMLQNDPRKDNTLGESGAGSLGYRGISSNIGIEFDTKDTNYGSEYDDPGDNHIGLNKNGNLGSLDFVEANQDMDSGNVIHAWIDYNGKNDKLEVFLSSTDQKPRNSLFSSKIDLKDTVGKRAYVGFSAATTDFENGNIDILQWNFSSEEEGSSKPTKSINGNNGNNRLTGTKNSDRINGKGGKDILTGAAGNDILTGGNGADDFLFGGNKPYSQKNLGTDKITDFQPEVDEIILERDVFITLRSKAGEGFSINREFDIVKNKRAVANSVADIVYDRSTGDLYYNANSALSGFGGGGKFATLEGAPNISESDFVLQ